jgi:glycosyltransferase 2 family protein
MSQRAFSALGRACITGGLLWWVISFIDVGQLRVALSRLDTATTVFAAVLVALQSLLIAWRWQRIVRRLGGELPASKSLLWVLVGQFCNLALPTSVGGDALRIWSLHRHGTAAGVAFSSVAVERATGVVILGLMVSLSVASIESDVPDSIFLALVCVGPLLLTALALLAFADSLPLTWFPSWLAAPLVGLARALRLLAAAPSSLLELMALSAAASTAGIAAAYVVGRSLQIDLPFAAYVAFVGGAALLALLPVSLGGWGVREAGMMALFATSGVASEAAVALSLVFGILPAAVALPGAVAWWLQRADLPGSSMKTGE